MLIYFLSRESMTENKYLSVIGCDCVKSVINCSFSKVSKSKVVMRAN